MDQGKAIAAMLFTQTVWGMGPVFLRSLSVELGPADSLIIRYVMVGLLYAAGLTILKGWRVARADWPRMLVISLIGMLGYNLGSVYGFAHAPAGLGGLVIGTEPALITLVGAIVERTWPGRAALLGIAVAFAGTVLLFAPGLMAEGSRVAGAEALLGGSFIFAGGIAWAIYVVAAKPLILRYGSFETTALSILISTLPLFALATPGTLDTARSMSAQNWADMAYLGVLSSFLGAVLWNYAAGRLPPAASGAFLYLVPVISLAAGAIMLGEPITATTITGGLLILAGVGITQFGGGLARRFAISARRA